MAWWPHPCGRNLEHTSRCIRHYGPDTFIIMHMQSCVDACTCRFSFYPRTVTNWNTQVQSDQNHLWTPLRLLYTMSGITSPIVITEPCHTSSDMRKIKQRSLLYRLTLASYEFQFIHSFRRIFMKISLIPILSIFRRERTIIGSVSYRYRYWVYRIESYRLLLYRPIYAHQCRFINYWQDCITHDDQRAFKRPVTRPPRVHACVLFYGPRYGRGLEGREAEGDCNLIPASPWHTDRAVLVLATITPHSPHRQEVITTVSCQSL